jgi:hypothetical protein
MKQLWTASAAEPQLLLSAGESAAAPSASAAAGSKAVNIPQTQFSSSHHISRRR